MNIFSKYLLESILGTPKILALFPGGFKPPTIGHFYVVQEILKRKEVDGIKIIIGPKDRDKINQESSKKIWEIYSKYLGPKVIIETPIYSPVKSTIKEVQNNPQNFYLLVAGYRDESDYKDLDRFKSVGQLPNYKQINIKGDNIRARGLRESIKSKDYSIFEQYLPTELSKSDKNKVWEILNETAYNLPKILKQKEIRFWALYCVSIFDVLEKDLKSYNKLKIKYKDNQEALEALEYFYDVISNKKIPLSEEVRKIIRNLKPLILKENKTDLSLEEVVSEVIKYMSNNGLEIKPTPKINYLEDEENSKELLGNTAFYDPNDKSISVYVTNRHPKDIIRSICHEYVHAWQDYKGKVGDINTTNTNDNEALIKLEEEAYLLGNILFRKWEDSIKH